MYKNIVILNWNSQLCRFSWHEARYTVFFLLECFYDFLEEGSAKMNFTLWRNCRRCTATIGWRSRSWLVGAKRPLGSVFLRFVSHLELWIKYNDSWSFTLTSCFTSFCGRFVTSVVWTTVSLCLVCCFSVANLGPWSEDELKRLMEAVRDHLLGQVEPGRGPATIRKDKLYNNIPWTDVCRGLRHVTGTSVEWNGG